MLGLTSHAPLKIPRGLQDAKGDPGAFGDVSHKRGNKGPGLGSVCHGMKLPQGGRNPVLRPSSLRSRGEKKPNSLMQRMAAGSQRLPAPPAPVEVSELKLASWKHQMLKHLTPRSSPPPAMPGWVSSALTWPRQPALLKFQEYRSTCQEMNLKDALDSQGGGCLATKVKLKQ